jgi:hypothetical protein
MHVIACRSVITRGFPQEKEVITMELGGQLREAP